MDALKLHKGVSKPSPLQEVFDSVVEEACGRKFSTGACLMSGAGGVSEAARLAAAICSVDAETSDGAEVHLCHLYEPRCIRAIQHLLQMI